MSKVKELTFAQEDCAIRETKQDKHRNKITAREKNVKHHSTIRKSTAHLETAKLLCNNALSHKGAQFITINIATFYLITPMTNYNWLRLELVGIPDEIIRAQPP